MGVNIHENNINVRVSVLYSCNNYYAGSVIFLNEIGPKSRREPHKILISLFLKIHLFSSCQAHNTRLQTYDILHV